MDGMLLPTCCGECEYLYEDFCDYGACSVKLARWDEPEEVYRMRDAARLVATATACRVDMQETPEGNDCPLADDARVMEMCHRAARDRS